MRRWFILLSVGMVLLLFPSASAWAGGTTYEALRTDNWRAPQDTPVEMCRMLITIDPLLEGEHTALLSLPDDFAWTEPDDTPSLENPAVVLHFEKTGDNEMLASLDYAEEPQKIRFLFPVVTTIPNDAEGDIVLSIEGIEGQLAPTEKGEAVGQVPGGSTEPDEPETPTEPPAAEPTVTPSPGETGTPADEPPATGAVFSLDGSTFSVNGREVTMDAALYTHDGRVYLPVRCLAMALGVPKEGVAWDGCRAVITGADRSVAFTPGSATALVDGQPVQMSDAVKVQPPGRLYLPVRAVADLFGAKVDWDPAHATVTVQPTLL